MHTHDLIRKYNISGPRYTSYPTALLLKPVSNPDHFRRELLMLADTGRELSLYIHLPFCRSLCWYCGCNKVISRNGKDADRYLDYLEKDFALTREFLPVNRRVTQVHLGGGTPTFLSPDQMMRLKLLIEQYFEIVPDAECSVEMDPRYLTRSQVQVLRAIGFNRASIGVQDLNEKVQKAIHRIQSFDTNRQAVEWLRESGFKSVNIDLIYGLPAQTPKGFASTLKKVMKLRPERLAIYNYAHLPDLFPAQKLIDQALLPSPEAKIEMLQYTIDFLRDRGYEYIGMDHFAMPEDELTVARKEGSLQRNFQGYSTRRGTETWAFGSSAISQTGPVMWQKYKSLQDYYAAIDRNELPVHKSYTLSADDILRREVIMRLMCGLAIDWDDLDLEFQVDSRRYFASERDDLKGLELDGLLIQDESGIKVTEHGRLFLRNIAMKFDAWLPKQSVQSSAFRPVYSRTI